MPPPETTKAMNRIDLTLRGQIWLRRRRLLRTWQPYVAAAVAVAIAIGASALPSSSLAISEVASTGFAYASITVAACISAIVLALGLPGGDRLRKWARHGTSADHSALSELIFVLVWGGIWQLLVIVVCSLALLFGGDGPLAPFGMSLSHWIGLIGGLWVFSYALLELFVVVETLWQIGAVIVSEERAEEGPATDAASPAPEGWCARWRSCPNSRP